MSEHSVGEVRKLLLKFLGEAHAPIELQVSPVCTFDELQALVLEKTGFEKERQVLKSGFPPKSFLLQPKELIFSVIGNLATIYLVKPKETATGTSKFSKINLKAARGFTARIFAAPVPPSIPAAVSQSDVPGSSAIPFCLSSCSSSCSPLSSSTSSSSSSLLSLSSSPSPSSFSTSASSSSDSSLSLSLSSGSDSSVSCSSSSSRPKNPVPLLPDTVVAPSARDLLMASAHRRRKSDTSSALTEGLEPEAAMGVLLTQSASLPVSDLDPTLRMFRRCLKQEVIKRAEQTLAEQRVAAALSGDYEFLQPKGHSLSSLGLLRVKFKTSPRTFVEEEHSFIPKPFLKLTISNVMQGEAQWKENFRPYNMALVSPRVFWSLIKEFGDVSSGLVQLCPEVDWAFLAHRKRGLSSKAKDNLQQAQNKRVRKVRAQETSNTGPE